MTAVHRTLAYAVIAVNLVAGIWGLWLYRRKRDATRPWWAALVAGQVILLTQVVIGVAMYSSTKPRQRLHPFYGFVLLIAAVLSYAYRGEGARRALLILSGVAMFVGVVAVRATLTGFGR